MLFSLFLFYRTNFHAMQALISMINIFRALSISDIYFVFIPLYVIDAEQTLADHVTHHMYAHSFTYLIVTVVASLQL